MVIQIGEDFPNFKASTTVGDIDFYDWLGDSWGILLSHPADFNPTLLDRIGEDTSAYPKSGESGLRLLGLSVNSLETDEQPVKDINSKSHGDHDKKFSCAVIADDMDTLATFLLSEQKRDTKTPLLCCTLFVVYGADRKLKLMFRYPISSGIRYDGFDIVQNALRFQVFHNKEIWEDSQKRKKMENEFLKQLVKELESTLTSETPPPPLTYCRGLVNFGKTCYINSIMQVLVHIPLLNSFFAKQMDDSTLLQNSSLDIENTSFLTVFKELLKEFQTRDSLPICKSASILLPVVWTKLPYVGFNKQHDVHEFFIGLINLMHEELLQSNGAKAEETQTIIEKIFFGRIQSEVTCTHCGISRYKDDPTRDLALEVVTDNQRESPMDLQDLLTHYTRIELLDDQNLLSCKFCEDKTKSRRRLKFKELPRVLCITLKRFRHNPCMYGSKGFTKINTEVRFPERLDLSPFKCASNSGEADWDSTNSTSPPENVFDNWYRLYAIVCHKGTYASGHYRTYLRKSSYWFLFDDMAVTRVSLDEVLKSEAYMLFYVRTFSIIV